MSDKGDNKSIIIILISLLIFGNVYSVVQAEDEPINEEEFNLDDIFYYSSHGKNNRLIQIENSTTHEYYYFDLFENNLIWVDQEYHLNEESEEYNYKNNIVLFNLSTFKKKFITTYQESESAIINSPKIFQNKIVWVTGNYSNEFEKNEKINYKFWIYDILTRNTTEFYNTSYIFNDTVFGNIDINGNYIIWYNLRNMENSSTYKIFCYNIKQNQLKMIHQTNNFISDPKINDNKIAWMERDYQKNRTIQKLMIHYINTNETKRLVNTEADKVISIDFEGNIVTWRFIRWINVVKTGINYYNLSSGEIYTLYSNTTEYETPSLFENLILYYFSDSLNLPYSGLYLHNTNSKISIRVVYGVNLYYYKLYGTKIILATYLNASFNIFLYDLETDSDNDGVFDYLDPDDDNDGYTDELEFEAWSLIWDNTSKPSDIDKDFVPDLLDEDKDGDGYNNTVDQFPENSDEWIDSDKDGFGDNQEDPYPNDFDNDGYPDSDDEFPQDPSKWEKEKDDSGNGFLPGFEVSLFLIIFLYILIKRRNKKN